MGKRFKRLRMKKYAKKYAAQRKALGLAPQEAEPVVEEADDVQSTKNTPAQSGQEIAETISNG